MPEQPQTSRGAATYQRILDAATEEFAQHGIAGARIERIVTAARTNKAQLYAYFGDKERLFDAIFLSSLERITNVVPIDADDLAEWAVRLYDEYLRRPDLIRLATWTRLEQPACRAPGRDAPGLRRPQAGRHRRGPGRGAGSRG